MPRITEDQYLDVINIIDATGNSTVDELLEQLRSELQEAPSGFPVGKILKIERIA